jgi:hypothetical protein
MQMYLYLGVKVVNHICVVNSKIRDSIYYGSYRLPDRWRRRNLGALVMLLFIDDSQSGVYLVDHPIGFIGTTLEGL